MRGQVDLDQLAITSSVTEVTEEQVHDTRINTAEAAIAGGWEPDLLLVLDVLGIGRPS